MALALRSRILAVIVGIWSCQVQFGRLIFLEPLTIEETLCAVEIMSGRFKLPSIEEIEAKKKSRKAKGKVLDVQADAPVAKEVVLATSTKGLGKLSTEAASSQKKKKALSDPYEDLENVIVKIPRSATAMTDPSSISKFVKGLFLEEDECRLAELGPLEAAKKAIALTYQALECNIFHQDFVESSQRRSRDLEKSNTSLRNELSEMKAMVVAAEKRVKEVEGENKALQATLNLEREVSKAEIEAYKESIESFKKEKEEVVERLEGVAYEAMLAEKSTLMQQYLSGEHASWASHKWIKKYARLEAGLSSSEGEEEEEEVGAASLVDEKAEDVAAFVSVPIVAEVSGERLGEGVVVVQSDGDFQVNEGDEKIASDTDLAIGSHDLLG